jgi:hypothetical protein
MTITEAQREVRREFLGGFFGQLVSGVLWLLSAALAMWRSPRSAIIALIVGGFFIFPVTWLLLRAAGRRPTLSPGNPMGQLGMQVAFVLPLILPLVGAAAAYRRNWFYPAFMVALGAHYLPFTFLYGMRMFTLLCGLLVGAGLAIGLYASRDFTTGGWVAGVILLIFAFVGRALVRSEERAAGVKVSA